jgi:gas vesicle protein
MTPQNTIEDNRCAHSMDFAEKLFLLVLGGGIGAAIALLFAPKAGHELRNDIKAEATRQYEETRAAADRLKERADEYYQDTREKGGDVVNVIVDGASDVKRDFVETAAKIGGIVKRSA